MKRLALALSLGLLFAVAVPMNSQSQSFKLGPRATISAGDISDFGGDFGLGGNIRAGAPGIPVDGDAAFTVFFADDPFTVWTLDLNALYPLPLENPVFSPYAGAGVAFTTISNGDSNTETALNLVGGVEFSAGTVSPFAELNIGVGDPDRVGVSAGLLFGF